MIIAAFDLARRTGFAFGDAGATPVAGSWDLRTVGEDIHLEPGRLVSLVVKLTKCARPDLVAVEEAVSVAAMAGKTSAAALEAQHRLHGALAAWAVISRIKMVRVRAQTCRKHMCGRASAGDRMSTKAMVKDRMIALGLVPANATDTDMTDAVCVWAWASDVHADVRGSFALVAS